MAEKVDNPEIMKRMKQLFEMMKTTTGPMMLSEVDQAIIAIYVTNREEIITRLNNEVEILRLMIKFKLLQEEAEKAGLKFESLAEEEE
jgi:hypothetical protein